MSEVTKPKIKPTKIVVVRESDGEFKAYATGDAGAIAAVDLFVVDFAICEEEAPEAEAVGVEEWLYCPRNVKSAVKDAA